MLAAIVERYPALNEAFVDKYEFVVVSIEGNTYTRTWRSCACVRVHEHTHTHTHTHTYPHLPTHLE